MVESFNRLSLDDLGFALQLKENSIWNYMMGMYFTWQGRFMVFLLNGVQMKSFFLFGSMMPFSIMLYILNILLISKTLVNFLRIKIVVSVLFAIVLFQLYIYSMFDISSYFWMCTKPYTFEISLGLFVLSDLICYKKESVLNYVVLFVSLAFLGCSYEIFAPIILLVLGVVLIYKFHNAGYNLMQFITHNRKLLLAFSVGTLFFILIIIAPGNWVRLGVHRTDANLSILHIFSTSMSNGIHLLKLLFFRSYYFLLFLVLVFVLNKQNKSTFEKKSFDNRIIIRSISFYLFIAVILCFVSILLNTIAVGKRMELRAFNHINLLFFLFIAFSVFVLTKKYELSRILPYLFPVSLMIIIAFNLYNIFSNYSELRDYVKSEDARIEYLEKLNNEGNKDLVKLKELDAPLYHSIDELWRIVVPKFSRSVLLKPNEVSWDINNFYNKAYKEYYNLKFNVCTTLDYGL